MDFPDNVPDLLAALARFERAHWDSLPAPVQQVIEANRASPVDLISRTAEALYANRDALKNKASRTLCAQLASFAGAHGWHGMRAGRGYQIAAAMQRDNDDPPPMFSGWPEPDSDPEPDHNYLPRVEADAVERD